MSTKRIVKFEIYRYDPDKDERPYMQKLEVELQPTDKMLLDALVRIKNDVDDSLALRRSCREGVCGSDAMNINGKNGLACTTNLRELKEPIVLRPRPAGDPRPDRGHDALLQPVPLDPPVPHQRHAAARKGTPAVARGPRRAGRSVSASCARAVPLPARRSGGIRTSSSARPACCRPRFIADSRDEATGSRLDNLEDPYRLFRCHTIMNCVDVCPKGLNPTKAIGKIKELMVRRTV